MAGSPLNGESIRAFLALPLSQVFSVEVGYVLNQLRPKGYEVRWVDPAQVHVTLHFFGSVPAPTVPKIAEFLRPLFSRSKAPALALKGVGCFPDNRRARVIWMGLAGDCSAVMQLQASVAEILSGAGYPSEDREFKIHATIGRAKKDRGIVFAAPDSLRAWSSEIQRIEHAVLYRSRLTPGGPRYETLETFPFAR